MGDGRHKWSGKRDSNSQPSAWKADALAIELFPLVYRSPLTGFSLSPTVVSALFSLVEGGGFEPPKSHDDRFTVCSLWPLGNPSTLGGRALPNLSLRSCLRNSASMSAKSLATFVELVMGLEPATC